MALLPLGLLCGVEAARAAEDLVINGDFDTSDCKFGQCAPWELSGSAKIVGGGSSASAGQALAFGANEQMGAVRQSVSLRPGNYDFSFRFYRDCADGLQTLVVASVGKAILFTRMFAGQSQCGWQKLSKKVHVASNGPADLLLRAQSSGDRSTGQDFLIDSLALERERAGQ